MENGTYEIPSGPVSVDFKGDEKNKNLPHVYVSRLAIELDTAPVAEAKVAVFVMSASGFEIQVADFLVSGRTFSIYEFTVHLPLVQGEILKIKYPNEDDRKIKIRVFHTYRV